MVIPEAPLFPFSFFLSFIFFSQNTSISARVEEANVLAEETSSRIMGNGYSMPA